MMGRCRAFGLWGTLAGCRMSDLLRVGFVAEGPTDYITLHVVDQRIKTPPQDLPLRMPCSKPCKTPCPRPRQITDALRQTILGWLNETQVPPRTVLCVPARSIETWVLVALFPDDATALKSNVECRRLNPAIPEEARADWIAE